MTRGYQHDPVTEYACQVEIAAAVAALAAAERDLRATVRRALDQGARAQVVAASIGRSRSQLYRWLSR